MSLGPVRMQGAFQPVLGVPGGVEWSNIPTHESSEYAGAKTPGFQYDRTYQPLLHFKLGQKVVFLDDDDQIKREGMSLKEYMTLYHGVGEGDVALGVLCVPFLLKKKRGGPGSADGSWLLYPEQSIRDPGPPGFVGERKTIFVGSDYTRFDFGKNDSGNCVFSAKLHMCFPLDNEVFWVYNSARFFQHVKEAENRDFSFALLVQGFLSSTQDAVWGTVNVQQLQTNPSEMINSFLRHYIEKRHKEDPTNTKDILNEALRAYEDMSASWRRRFIKQLSPKVHSACEGLLALFSKQYPYIFQAGLTIQQLAFLIRRHEKTRTQFATCVSHYIVKLDQDRGTRNASYKSMNNTTMASIHAIQYMGDVLRQNLGVLHDEITRLIQDEFDPLIMDWSSIVTQLRLPAKLPNEPTEYSIKPFAL